MSRKNALEAREENPLKASTSCRRRTGKSGGIWHALSERAYRDVIERCASPPWWIVPSDRKWYRDYCAADAVVKTLGEYEKEWRQALKARARAAKKR